MIPGATCGDLAVKHGEQTNHAAHSHSACISHQQQVHLAPRPRVHLTSAALSGDVWCVPSDRQTEQTDRQRTVSQHSQTSLVSHPAGESRQSSSHASSHSALKQHPLLPAHAVALRRQAATPQLGMLCFCTRPNETQRKEDNSARNQQHQRKQGLSRQHSQTQSPSLNQLRHHMQAYSRQIS